jgi:hypothetical protein
VLAVPRDLVLPVGYDAVTTKPALDHVAEIVLRKDRVGTGARIDYVVAVARIDVVGSAASADPIGKPRAVDPASPLIP